MFNNIILKINILPFMIGIRHTDVKDFWKKSCLFTPSHLPSPSPGDLSQATGLLLNR